MALDSSNNVKMEVWEKSETVDPEVRAYVYSLVTAVGGQSTLDDRYAIGDDALPVLNDLLRWIRLYDDKTNRYDVKRCLAEANVVKGDLLEILALWPEEAQENKWKAKLALACVQLMVSLTWPMRVGEDTTTRNHVRHMPYLQLAQVGYKRAILHYEDAGILRTAVRIGLPALAVERRERSRRDEGIIKIMLYFFRNLATITQPQELPSQGDENEISRSATIEAFHQQDVFNLLLTVGSGAGDEFQEHDVIVLEILFHLLKGVDAKKLFMEKEQLANEEIDELQNLMQKEKAMLNSYNKHAPTRHNRFGTMLWVKRDDKKMSTVTGQNVITNSSTTLLQMDASKRYNKPKYRGKLVQEFNETSDFGMRVDLTDNARKHLRSFVEEILDSSFNPLFASLRRAIERETERVAPSNHRQFWYLISWFLTAEASRRDRNRAESSWNADRPSSTNPEDNTFAYIAAVLDQETFVLLNRHMQRSFDEKSWQDLQGTLLCFTQILLTVQNMAESKDEEDQEIAENIQNRIFYEEGTHDRIVQICRGYTHQGFAYLDAVTELVHVFVRMLERYSKVNVDLQIRSKRRARRKKKDQSQNAGSNPEAEDVDDAAEDEREAQLTVSERKFDFTRFSAKFLSQGCVNTFLSLLHFYADLSPSQLKRCHRFFYRVAFKNELAVLLFRADILLLFHRMIKGPSGLDQTLEGFRDWETLVQQIFRHCIKWIGREQEGEGWKEASVVEMLFSKIPGTAFYLQNGYERVVEKRAPRPPAELEFKGAVGEDKEKRVGVAVSVMLELGKLDEIEWVKKNLKNAEVERRAWDDERSARSAALEGEGAAEGSADVPVPPPTIFVTADGQERKDQLFKDKYLRLLLTTLGLQRLGTAEDVDASWMIPSELSASQLKEILNTIQKVEHDPPVYDDGKNAQEFIRNKPAARNAAAFSDHSSSEDEAEAQFPPNLREKHDNDERPKKRRRLTRRNRGEFTEEQLKAKADERKRKERERNHKIKSQLFVTESDDESDDERDAEFFALEEARRNRMARIIRSQLLREAEGVLSDDNDDGLEGTYGRKRKRVDDDDDDEQGEVNDRGNGSESPSPDAPPTHLPLRFSSDDEDEDSGGDPDLDAPAKAQRQSVETVEEHTPPTSPTALDNKLDALPLGEVSGNVGTAKQGEEESVDGDDDGPVGKPAVRRRNVRAGFIIDDSDSE